jgi:PDZ domain
MRTHRNFLGRFFLGIIAAASGAGFLFIGTNLLFASEAPNATVPQIAAMDRASIHKAVSGATNRLDSPRFMEREEASRELTAAGAPAVAALLDVAKEGSLEAAVRAVGILEAIYLSSGDLEESLSEELACEFDDRIGAYLWVDLREAQTTADAAEFALDELERSGRPAVAERAEVVLQSHYDIRERRAVSEIERLHGKAIFGNAVPVVMWNPRANVATLPNELQPEGKKGRGELTMVIVGPKWTGGDEGLKHVARLKRLQHLYRIEGKQVTDQGILRLRAALPMLDISVRAAAKLGIEHRPDGLAIEGCKVDTVKEGEAAANAGLQSNDVILRFAGQSVVNFDSLIEILHHYNPGDKVEALVLRNERPMTFELTLTGWD